MLILPDVDLAQRERTLLERLEIGLADEGIRVAHGLPASLSPLRVGGLYSTVVHYQDRWPGLIGSLRARALVELLDEAIPRNHAERGEPLLEVVHCFGRGSWPLGRRVAEQTGAALVLELADGPSCAAAAAALDGFVGICAVSVADAALSTLVKLPKALADGSGPRGQAQQFVATWGVHAPERTVSQLSPPGRLEVITLLATGEADRNIFAALKGLCDFLQTLAEDQRPLIMVDAALADRCRVYRWLEQLGFAGRLCEVTDLEGQRDVIAESDVLLLPDSIGQQRSSVLEAMAAGTIVVAAADAHNSALVEGVTCMIVRGSNASDWAAALLSLLPDQAKRAALSDSASLYIGTHRTASAHVQETVAIYRQVIKDKEQHTRALVLATAAAAKGRE